MIRNIYIAVRDGEEIEGRTMVELGRLIGANASSISRAASERRELSGYTIRKVQREMSDGIVAVTPDGRAFRFDSLADAARACRRDSRDLRSVSSSIRWAINHNITYLNLEWKYAEGYRGDFSDPSLFEGQAIAFAPKSNPQRFRSELRADEKADTRTPIATGYYCPGFLPAVCPICGKVISNNDVAVAHLTKCLDGHDYQTIHNVIKVFK